MSRKRRSATPNSKPHNITTPKQHGVTIHEQQYSGPIPPPAILEGFEQIVPGSAERILRMAEENGKHQREIEKEALSIAL